MKPNRIKKLTFGHPGPARSDMRSVSGGHRTGIWKAHLDFLFFLVVGGSLVYWQTAQGVMAGTPDGYLTV